MALVVLRTAMIAVTMLLPLLSLLTSSVEGRSFPMEDSAHELAAYLRSLHKSIEQRRQRERESKDMRDTMTLLALLNLQHQRRRNTDDDVIPPSPNNVQRDISRVTKRQRHCYWNVVSCYWWRQCPRHCVMMTKWGHACQMTLDDAVLLFSSFWAFTSPVLSSYFVFSLFLTSHPGKFIFTEG